MSGSNLRLVVPVAFNEHLIAAHMCAKLCQSMRRARSRPGGLGGQLGVETVAQIENKVLLPDAKRGSSSSSSAADNKRQTSQNSSRDMAMTMSTERERERTGMSREQSRELREMMRPFCQ